MRMFVTKQCSEKLQIIRELISLIERTHGFNAAPLKYKSGIINRARGRKIDKSQISPNNIPVDKLINSILFRIPIIRALATRENRMLLVK